jgi:hypothetical protein
VHDLPEKQARIARLIEEKIEACPHGSEVLRHTGGLRQADNQRIGRSRITPKAAA